MIIDKIFNQYYTKPKLAEKLTKDLDFDRYDFIIEPAAGECSFYNFLPEEKRIGIDLCPKCDGLIEADFLEWKEPFKEGDKILSIGNPPFGRNSSLAIKFINKCAKWSETIAFIVPKSFKKQSMYDKIDLNFWKIKEVDTPKNSFVFNNKPYDVPCIWLILEKRNERRTKEIKLKPPASFTFTNKENSNCCFRRVGINAGFSSVDINVAEPSHYFINANDPLDFVNRMNQIIWNHNNTTGPRSISKNELIEAYNNSLIQLK